MLPLDPPGRDAPPVKPPLRLATPARGLLLFLLVFRHHLLLQPAAVGAAGAPAEGRVPHAAAAARGGVREVAGRQQGGAGEIAQGAADESGVRKTAQVSVCRVRVYYTV